MTRIYAHRADVVGIFIFVGVNTVKTLYNVTRYNRIFNIQHKIAWNGSVSIKIPSL